MTLGDVAPTLMGLLGVTPAPEVRDQLIGVDLRTVDESKPRTLFWSCWFELRCRGMVRGSSKVVFSPEEGKAYHFDLATDPDERRPGVLPGPLRELLPVMNERLDSHRTYTFPLELGETSRTYGSWRCAPNGPCTHPKSRPPSFGH